jgi:CheY-like chemotaxis protein
MAGFQVVTAVDGHDAMATLDVRDPHLIVSDLMMPRQGGYDFLRNLRGAGGRPIPIFIMTGNSLDSSTIAMIMHESGAVEFFKKPIQTPVFLAAVHRVLNTTPKS